MSAVFVQKIQNLSQLPVQQQAARRGLRGIDARSYRYNLPIFFAPRTGSDGEYSKHHVLRNYDVTENAVLHFIK